MPVKVLGHRTGMKLAPENSLEGFRHCQENGASAVECDVTFIDGVPAVWARGTKNPEPDLWVEDVLEFVSQNPGMKVYFDVKFYEHHLAGHFLPISTRMIGLVREKVIRLAMRRGLAHRIGFVTFCGGARLLQAAKSLDVNIATDLMVIFPWIRPGSYRKFVDAVTIGWDANLGNHWKFFPGALARIMSEARAMGMQVRGGLANTTEDIDWLLARSADAIWTDDVPFVAQYLSGQKSRAT